MSHAVVYCVCAAQHDPSSASSVVSGRDTGQKLCSPDTCGGFTINMLETDL